MSFFIKILLEMFPNASAKQKELEEPGGLRRLFDKHKKENQKVLEKSFLDSHEFFVTEENTSELAGRIKKYFFTELEATINKETTYFTKYYEKELKNNVSNENPREEKDILYEITLEYYLTLKQKLLLFLLNNQEEIRKRLQETNADLFSKVSMSSLWQDLYHNKLASYMSKKISEAINTIEVNFRLPKNIISGVLPKSPSHEEYTLFDFACASGDERLVRRLINLGWNKLLPNERHKTSEQIAKEGGFKTIQKILEEEKPKTATNRKRRVFAMVKRMQADKKSPVKKLTVLLNNQVAYENMLEGHIDEDKFRPAIVSNHDSKEVITPGKTLIHQTWDLVINRDSHAPQVVRLYLNDRKPEVEEPPDEEQLNEILEKFYQNPISKKLPKNSKISRGSNYTIKRAIHYGNYKEWQQSIANEESRYRDQNQVMGNISAENVAKAAGFNVESLGDWQWCHLIAYSLGGEDGVKPEIKEEYEHKGPQRETNLVVGTREANAHMLIVEDMLKKLILSKEFPNLTVILETEFLEKLKDFHIAKEIKYTIQDHSEHPNKQITFTIDMLSRRKISPEETEILPIIMNDLFSTGAQQLVAEENIAQQSMTTNTGSIHNEVTPRTPSKEKTPVLFGAFARHREECTHTIHTPSTEKTAVVTWENFTSFDECYSYSQTMQATLDSFLSLVEDENNPFNLNDEQRCIILLNICLTFLQSDNTEENKNSAAQAFDSAATIWISIGKIFTNSPNLLRILDEKKQNLKNLRISLTTIQMLLLSLRSYLGNTLVLTSTCYYHIGVTGGEYAFLLGRFLPYLFLVPSSRRPLLLFYQQIMG